ncbi:MAG TPA: LysM domain-containing protein [Acidobacteriota bacterium]|nr:LysM domain-containing protein [Acidobacteriota bacterium]
MRIEKGGGVGGPGSENLFEHNVQQGDTLDSIAGQYGVTKESLLETNRHITAETLQPGQILQIPQGTAAPDLAPPAPDKSEPFEPDAVKDAFNQDPEYVPDDLIKFAPPYVPVHSLVPPDDVSENTVEQTVGEPKQLNITPEQFHIDQEGNLVIKNRELIEFFQNLAKNTAENQDLTLGIAQLKRPKDS